MKITDIIQFARLARDRNVKVSLNKHPGTGSKDSFAGKIMPDQIDYACWNSPHRRNFTRSGLVNLAFVRVNGGMLFAGAFRIDEIVKAGDCPHTDVSSEYGLDKYVRRLIVREDIPSKAQGFVFNSDRLFKLVVVSYSDIEANSLEWTGYDSVRLPFSKLYEVLETELHPEYRAHLEDVCAVYLLIDNLTGKKYVGSAYGSRGLAQRWRCYLDTGHGGNKKLKELFETHGFEYFKRNFEFRLRYHFPLGTNKKRVIAKESEEKELLGTKSDGFNAN